MNKTLKRWLAALLVLVQIISLSVSAAALESSEIFSNEALVVNMDTDEVLYSKNTKDESVEIASLTKVMTYALSVEHIEDLSTKIAVPVGTKQEIIDQDGSNAGLEDEYEYTALDLLYGLMLPSGCDAADVLAKYIGGGDYGAFIAMMNEKAAALGMEDTVFYTASGLENENGERNVSTEQDLYKLAKYAYDLPYFKQIIGTEFYDVVGTKDDHVDTNTVRNTNYMMGEYNGAEYYYLYSLGGKTGNTSGAGRCLISFARKGDLEVVAITLGVPNEHGNYHLDDHRKLFDHVFETFSENITVDIGSEYKSVGIGEQIRITPVTSEETTVTWSSSDESVAVVNEDGIVSGLKQGQAKIVATTETGNQDYAYVSVGFYNGIDIKYNAGPSDPNGILGYGELDWSIISRYGIDFAVVRAGYALGNNPDEDPYFVKNIENAFANDINVMISFDGYATAATYAEKEAEYLIEFLQDNIPDYLDAIELPIVYNLFNSSVSDPATLTEVIFAFCNTMQEAGYEVVVEMGRTLFSALDLEDITDSGIGLYVIYRPYVPDHQTRMTVSVGDVTYDADLWQYRSDAYFGETGIAKRIIMSAMYMDFAALDTAHPPVEQSPCPIKPEIAAEGEYVYSGEEIEAVITGFDPDTMNIEGAVGKQAGTYTVTVTPKETWRDGSTDPVSVTWTIEKADPQFEVPRLTARRNTALQNIALPEHFSWVDPTLRVSAGGKYAALYVPADPDNYNTVEVELQVYLISSGSSGSGSNGGSVDGDAVTKEPVKEPAAPVVTPEKEESVTEKPAAEESTVPQQETEHAAEESTVPESSAESEAIVPEAEAESGEASGEGFTVAVYILIAVAAVAVIALIVVKKTRG